MFGLGTPELILILVIVLIIFGVGKLPDIGSGMGKAIRNFKKASSDAEIDVTPNRDDGQKIGSSANRSSEKKA
ncbi:MAG: twin-arginine translocase TatA/TatE family subunit [Deltaproteobacteria bacterium]|nr:twin-arginine translocase TatA/TatE family subunit [Deltaproteobacteria bacterium]